MRSQLTLVSNSLPLYQTGKLYFKIRSTHNARVTYPTVQNDSASTIGTLFTTYSVTNVEAPFKILDSTKFWKTYRVTFDDTTNIDNFISGLQALTTVEYAEKVPAMYTQSTPNDPNYPYHLSLINANTASNIHIATGSAIVAIVDDAVSTTQEDLVANMSSTNRDVADLDNNCDPPLTGAVYADGVRFTHGTHVAGIAGAVTNNSLGIASIGWNNKIMGVKARKNTDATSAIPFGFDGIAWAAANGAHVINMSWGGGAPSLTEYSVVVTAKSANVVLVAAAGNANSTNAFYPAAYGEGFTGQAWEVFDEKLVVAVASLDANSDISNWGSGSGSNHGSWVDISAYGSSIYSTLASGNGITAINNVYGSLNGTSMAAPMVAGAAGLLKSYNMSKTADDIITCLIYTANPDIYNPYVHLNNFPGTLGIGRLDVAAALMCIKPSCTYPSAVIKPSSVSLCPSSSVTLTSNPAVSYTWSTGANTQSIAVSSAAIYTLTINNGTCTASQTINIQNANTTANLMTYENSSLLPNDGIVCGPDFFSISCYSGLTYTWSPAWSTSQTLGTSINLGSSAPVSAVISVTIGGVGGCVGITSTASKTISNLPLPTIVVTPSVGSVSAGCGILLTASGGVSYTWSPASLVSCSVCSTPTAYPISPSTNYTVLGVDANNCFNTKTASISVTTNTYCSGTAPATHTVFFAATYNPSIGYLGQNLYLATGGNYTITCPDLRIAGNVGIYVANNATLTVDGSWLHACATCSTGMWRGIIVEPGGLLRVKNYSIIEDAIKAINTASNASTSPVAKWEVTSSILNKNGSDIYVEKTYADMSGSYEYNTIFTCRELTSHTIGSTNFNSIRSSISAATPSSPGSHTPTVTLAGSRSSYGINLDEAVGGTINIGSSSQTSNIFDNLDYGIFSAFSPIVVRNNTFQNLTGNNGIGTGILVSGNSWEVAAPTVVIGNSDENIVAGEGNNFTNCLQGVQIMGCQHVAINKNTFTNETTSTTFTTGSQIGQYAVINTGYAVHSYTNNPYEYLRFCNNYVKNYATGYYFDFGRLYNTAGANQSFNSNTITATGTSTAYCNQGLYLQQSNTFGAVNGISWNAVSVTSNSITNAVVNAIALNAVGGSRSIRFVDISSNTELSVKYNSSATSSVSPHIAAVYLSGCYRILISNNNKIECTGLSSYPSSNAQYIAGIYISASANSTVNCNTVKFVGEGFVWEGNSAGSKWQKNNVQSSRYGLVLRNSGIMGDQGATNSPIGDIYGRYISTNITDAHTLADNSDPSLSGFTSKLYNLTGSCSSATTYSPCQNNQLSGTAYAPGTTIFTTTGSLPCICTGDCGSGKLIMTSEDSLVAIQDSILMDIVRGIEGTTPLPSFDQETRWTSQYYVSSQNSTLRSATGYNNAKTLAIVDGAIDGNNYVLAKSFLNALTPGNTIESNWYIVDDILIKMQTADLDNSDLSNLKTIAEKCPLTDGNIVYRARAVLNNYYKTIFTYSDNCDNNNSRKATATSNGSDQAQIFTIYPNPNNGYMTFAYNLAEDATLEIVDVKGIVVEKHKLSAAANQMQVQNSSLADGIYFYRLVNTSNSTFKTGKLVIIK